MHRALATQFSFHTEDKLVLRREEMFAQRISLVGRRSAYKSYIKNSFENDYGKEKESR
jgi:hypothetical protein